MIHIPDREFGITEDQFIKMMYLHQQPALALQKDMRKSIITITHNYWKKVTNKDNKPSINFNEVYRRQKEFDTIYDEELKKLCEWYFKLE